MTNNFTSTVTQLLRDNVINMNEFWNQIQNKKNSFYYSLKLFDIISGQRKREKYLHVVERMTSMVLILEYFYIMEKREPKLIEDSRSIVRKIEAEVSLASRWIFEMFLQSSDEQVFIQGFLRVLAEIPLPRWLSESEEQKERELEKEMKNKNKQLMQEKKEENLVLKEYLRVKHVQEENRLKVQPYYGRIKLVETLQKNSEFAFGYICFVDYMFVKDLKLSQSIYKEIIEALYQLLNLSSQTKIHTGIVMMLHFVQNIIRFYVLPYRQKVKQLLIVMRQFRNFPIPIGVLAQEIVQMLYDEIKVLGFTYRYNMRVNLPSLDVMEADSIDYTAYFVSQTQHLLNNNAFCSIDTLRKALVLNMIWRVNVNEEKKERLSKLTKKISRMPLQTAYQYYSKLLKIGEICMSASTIEQTIKIQQKAIDALVTEISNIPEQDMNQFDHVIKQMKQIYKNEQYNFFQFPQCEIKCISLGEFTDKDSKVQNFRAILENQANVYRLHQQKFRVIFRGTDRQFRSIVQRIGERYEQKEGALSLRTLELYILPEKKSQSMLAAYIAKFDCWYSQFVYSGCASQHFYPECNILKHDNLPGMMIAKVLQCYIREATRHLNIRLFKCCLQFQNSKKSQNVFFCRSIEMGLSALVSKYRYSKPKYEDMDYMQLLLEKVKDQDKLNEQITVIMQMDVCDMFGEDIETVSFEEVKISDLRLCNIPVEYFFGKEPCPTSDSLQISILKTENAKEFQKLLKQKSLFKKSDDQIMFAFRSIFECESIKSMFVQSNGKGMSVCIDGEIFNDVVSVRVDTNDKKMKENKLPIKTFLPFKMN